GATRTAVAGPARRSHPPPSRRRGYASRRCSPPSVPVLVSLEFMRALVVVNPAATATTPKTRDILLRALASELKIDLAETPHRGHARELGERAVADGVDVVVTLGGDGTVNEVVNGLLTHGPSPSLPLLAVVPGAS